MKLLIISDIHANVTALEAVALVEYLEVCDIEMHKRVFVVGTFPAV